MLNNERIKNEIRISNKFNNYFVSVGSTLASKINDHLTAVIHLTIFKVMFKAWPYLIIMKIMSHLQ